MLAASGLSRGKVEGTYIDIKAEIYDNSLREKVENILILRS